MQPAVLIGLLGATMVAAVSSMPVDNRKHNEEMVTRCIIEVLSNALSKSITPPITPECRQVLKKSAKEVKDEEKSENENTRFEVRLLRDSADASEAHRPSDREDAGVPGEDAQVANTEGGGHSQEGAGEPQRSLSLSDSQVSKVAKTHHSEKSEEEDREEEEGDKNQGRERGEGGSEEKHLEEPGETRNAFLNEGNQVATKKNKEIVSRYYTHSSRLPEEKTHSRERNSQESEGHYRLQENHMDKAMRHPQGEWKEQDKNYLNYGEEKGEEGDQGKWQQQEDLQDSDENREEARLQGKQYALYHTSEKRKRLGELLNQYYDPSLWKSSYFERKDNPNDNFLEGEEENGLTLNEKNFFPEYNYDWWEKKPFEEDVNWGYEKRNLAPKLDLKRQYDRVAELDQLLHYRKKSAEFPDFYDSEDQMSPRHAAENAKDRAGPRVLTEEEEKELENLAAMDLELQKIAEKFSGNRRG
uniref:Secretogranin-1 n=1 Tax=Rousettus aegyptiacus TaxID=9407 RepID=A0A7J8DFR6_ROUAE|nr:chromogranin B [Rousettus aegyptiacus]